MPEYVRRTPIGVSAKALFDWHSRPGALPRLLPPWQRVEIERFEGIAEGSEAQFRVGAGPLSVRWVARHHDVIPGRQFVDTQEAGPFAAWTHTHRMTPQGTEASVLEDHVRYRLPMAAVSQPLGGGLAESQLDRMFAYRHRVTKTDLERHAAAGLAPRTIAITGASGFIGTALAAFLSTGGHRVVRLVRSRKAVLRSQAENGPRAIYWNVERGEIDEFALAEAAPDAVIHLAGEPVPVARWTATKKRLIWESRTKGTQLLSRALARMDRKPTVLLSTSASGIYGDRATFHLSESDPLGTGFLAEVCKAWEASTEEAEVADIRTVHLRIGLVLSPAGGMLGMLLPLFQSGLGGWVGRGERYLPWIALDDLLYAVLHLLASDTTGPVNLSAPTPVTDRAFAETLGRVLKRPVLARAPTPLLAALGGEAARETVLTSARMLPRTLLDAGFVFAYPHLPDALGHLLGTVTDVPVNAASP